ncbi:nucleotidyl transferase AbiEii/AbiGii toxin family protein [Burkholderia sp. Bp9142]|uniref:nucleotidyl transferase AbiEii/AbiGii toxin family protein n=2 Tax=unclassified Burkholderia TaxID=2613784 RepID=UPI000F594C0B|nr:nucleotidyl transferase AbiEii/AbiGii toxin family protein [Burkholderia sp. Bp9142]RQR36752.1 nucleotidyl transferase AbiEii/AbiGii toxin family protein [Burkholderia sp. Bp9142]
MNQIYVDTVRLMLAIAPIVFDTPCFAMKGGTALNLFLHDMPRLSVDIDVVVTDRSLNREEALEAIDQELDRTRKQIEADGHATEFSAASSSGKAQGDDVKLVVISGATAVKVEVNYIFRGTLLDPVQRALTKQAEDTFSTSIEVPTLHEAELYGSKLVAALDRQHPRDLFDVMHMYSRHGLRPDIVDAFVGYLSGHNRPIHEVLFGPKHSMAEAYDADFVGMTADPIDLATLEETQKRLHRELPASLTENHRQFLISLVRAEPDWSLMPYAHLRELPALRGKLINLENLKKKKPEVFAQQESALRENFARQDKEHAPADAVTDTTPRSPE